MADPRGTLASVLWNHAGRILEYVLMYLTSVLIARGLGVQNNGIFVGLFSVSQLLLVVTSLGLEVSLNKHIPQLDTRLKEGQLRYLLRRSLVARVTVSVSVGFVLLGVFHLFPSIFPTVFPDYVWLLLAYTGIRSLANLFITALTAQLLTRATAIINVLARAMEVVLIGFLASTGITPSDVFLVLVSVAGIQVITYVLVMRGYLSGEETRLAVFPIFLFGGVYWTNNLAEYFLGRQGDVLFLSSLLSDPAQASLYDVAFAVTQLASLSMTVGLGGVTLATSARLAMQDSDALDRFYGFMIRITSMLSIPLYAFVLFNAGSVLSVLYSTRYAAAAGIVQGIAAFRIVGRLFGGPENAEFLLSRSRVTKLVGIGIIGAVVNVGLDVMLIPRIGTTGAVVGSGLGNLAVNGLGSLAVYQISTARVQWKFWLKLVAASCGGSLLCSLIIVPKNITLILLQIVSYAGITVLLFSIVKPLTNLDGNWLSRIDSRLIVALRFFVRRSPDVEPL